jgi:hypothetical protein
MSHFDKLCDELDAIRARREEARELSDMASGNNAAGREFRKSLAATTEELTALAPKPRRTVFFVRKDEPPRACRNHSQGVRHVAARRSPPRSTRRTHVAS